MKRLQRYIVIFGTAMLCVGFSACSKQSDFDAKSYVKSSLDAEYHGNYADYANLMEISEKDVKKQIQKNQRQKSQIRRERILEKWTQKNQIMKIQVQKNPERKI